MTDLDKEIVSRVGRVLPPAGGPYGLHEPTIDGREWDYVKECLDSGWVSAAGAHVGKLEEMVAEFVGTAHVVATVSGTAALHVSLLLAGAESGDEVLVPTLTYVATANSVSYCAAIPHFVDSDGESLGVDAKKLAAYLEEIADLDSGVCRNRRTGRPIRALIVVHCLGHPADMDELTAVCDTYGIALVEDVAEALGSYYRGAHVGRHGQVSALSFNGNKIVTTGGGGAIITDDAEIARRAKHLTTTARAVQRWEHAHDEVGFNYRMPALNAALGCAQMERLSDLLTAKRQLSEAYRRAFEGLNAVTVMTEPSYGRSNFWMNTIVLDAGLASERDQIMKLAGESGYVCWPAWRPLHRLPMYIDCPRMGLDYAEDIKARMINLPSGAGLISQ